MLRVCDMSIYRENTYKIVGCPTPPRYRGGTVQHPHFLGISLTSHQAFKPVTTGVPGSTTYAEGNNYIGRYLTQGLLYRLKSFIKMLLKSFFLSIICRKNLVAITIFYQATSYELHEQQGSYSLEAFLGKINVWVM